MNMINNYSYTINVINMKKINFKTLIIYILIPLIGGGIIGLITNKSMSNYDGTIPGWIFPVVWSILYILMGISSYLVKDNKNVMKIYWINLIINYLWPIIFFLLNLKVLGFFWILLLILIVGYMIYKFYQENKLSAYLLIPYLILRLYLEI